MEEQIVSDSHAIIQPPVLTQTPFLQTMAARGDSPSRRGAKVMVVPSMLRSDDLEELDDDDEDGDEMVQEVEAPSEDTDLLTDNAGLIPPTWTMDWGDLDQERRSFRKRPVLGDLPDEVREELASMSGAETEIRPKQKPKLDPSDIVKEPTRGRKSPADEEGTADTSFLLTRPAKTAEERLAVLEARDKLIRVRSNQQRCPKLKNVGKCPDMCSEKERYQRIARHQVDYYEYNRETKEVNHASMVKIYARSSADQQMPLPHDLRPVNVLWMTMGYLVNQFMDLADSPGENLGEWYHFLWDRMRSIRKDVTQLALCDTVSVQILEMCARFHIFCMERLREEKMAVFDEKINRENLTKCLQSLQYMYNDLFLKNVSCPNEPEFQAYSILLHINSDLCTSMILGLRSEMRQHEKVKFAINAFLAVTMKNYVRFFKLVKSTTYLNACILHQYFAQVRAHAMHSIIRAYSRQKMRNTYPLSELQGQLLFDSIDDVLEFCRFSKVPVEENNVVLEKNTVHPIPMQEKMKRSFVGVECKRQSSIREIVAGGCQLSNATMYHKVHDSFDEQGILKQEALYAEDQIESVLSVGELGVSASSTTLNTSTSSVHTRSNLRGFSPPEEVLSTISTSLTMTTPTSLSAAQNSGTTVPHKSIFGVSIVSANSTLLEVPRHKREELNDISRVVTSISDSAERLVEHEGDVALSKVTSCNSSLLLGQPCVNTNSFVFRLSNAQHGHQKPSAVTASMMSGKVIHTSPSIFGGSSSSTINRSPGLSILRMPSSGHSGFSVQQTVQSESSGYWKSTSDHHLSHISENNPSPMEIGMPENLVTSESKDSALSFKTCVSSSTAEKPVEVPGFFMPGKTDFWGSNSSKPLNESLRPFVTAATSAAASTSGLTVASAVSNQFPASVYGLSSHPISDSGDKGQRNEQIIAVTSSESPCSQVTIGFPSSPDYSQHFSETSHVSPLHVPPRAVTVPTSIFGLHSRPLTTPQMFSTSVSSSSVTVSLPNTPTSSSSTVAVTKAMSEGGGFVFSLGKNTTLPVSSSTTMLPNSHSSQIDTDKVPIIERRVSHEAFQRIIGDQSQISPATEMEVDSDEDVETTKQFTFKSEQMKIRSPVATMQPTSFPSPSHVSQPKKPILYISKVPLQKPDINKEHRIHELVKDIFRQWRLLAYRAKLKRRIESHKICAPLGTSLSLEEQVSELPIPQGCVAIDFHTRLEYLLDVEEMKISQSVLPDVGKLKIEKILRNVLPKALADKGKFESNMFWKLYISLPDESEGRKFSLQLCEWIDETFFDDSDKQKFQDELLSVARTQLGEGYNLFTSVQRSVGLMKGILQGVNGILFFTPRNMTNIENVCNRYQKLIDASLVHFPVPVVAVVSNAEWADVCHEWFISDIEKGRIEAFKIILPFQEKRESVFRDFSNSMVWLTQYIIPAPPFEFWPLREVVLTLMIDLWTRVRFSLFGRCSSGRQQHPTDLFNLYHDALKRFHSMVVNSQLDQYGDIPPELENLACNTLGDKYKSRTDIQKPDVIKKINEGFVHFQLNIEVPPVELLSVESLCETVCLYNPRLRSPISHFLCQRNGNDNIDWTCIVEALTEMHIRDMIGEFKLKNLILVFVKSEIDNFRMKPWYSVWLKGHHVYEAIEDTEVGNDSDTEVDSDKTELDPSTNCSDFVVPELDDPDQKLLSDFESMLNELEKMNQVESLKVDLNNAISPQALDTCNKYKCVDDLDKLEAQLEKFAELLKN